MQPSLFASVTTPHEEVWSEISGFLQKKKALGSNLIMRITETMTIQPVCRNIGSIRFLTPQAALTALVAHDGIRYKRIYNVYIFIVI